MKYYTIDGCGNLDTWEVCKDGNQKVRRNFSTKGYFFEMEIDGNSVTKVSWKHGNGKGSVTLPSGEIYDIFTAMHILNEEFKIMGKMYLTKAIKEI